MGAKIGKGALRYSEVDDVLEVNIIWNLTRISCHE